MPAPSETDRSPSADWWVLGLGNPGTRYASTRHNLGFRVVDALAHRAGVSLPARPAPAQPTDRVERSIVLEGRRVVLVKPMTYMNRSGAVADALVCEQAADARRMLAIYDDIDLELGKIRLRPHGGAGGHNGIRSLIDRLETDRFPRLRLGIRGGSLGPESLADYVLDPFEPDERAVVDKLVEMAADAVQAVVADGLPSAMNRWNGRSATGNTESKRKELEKSTEPQGEGTATDIRSNGNDGISG